MDDDRLWQFERELWLGGTEVYRQRVSQECVMGLPAEPFVFDGPAATAAVEQTPRWEQVDFVSKTVSRPREGLIVIGYRAQASRGTEIYHALATSTLMQLEDDRWVVVQHQQTPFAAPVKDPEAS